MYQPLRYRIQDRAQTFALMKSSPFATLIAVVDGVPEVNHIPLLVCEGEPLRLEGHVARANPLAKLVASGTRLTALFHGPHAYVSPRYYTGNSPQVPTWNYAVVHAHGTARLVPEPSAVLGHLRRLSATFEGGAERPWTLESTGTLPEELLPALVAFEIEVDRLETKFKLSQNRTNEDWAAVLERFASSDSAEERAVAALMKLQGPPQR